MAVLRTPSPPHCGRGRGKGEEWLCLAAGWFGELDLLGGELLFAVHFLDGAGDLDLFGFGAELGMELLGDIILFEVIGGLFSILLDLENVLAIFGFLEGAFAAFAFAGQSDFFIRGDGGGDESDQGEEGEGIGDSFHGNDLVEFMAMDPEVRQ